MDAIHQYLLETAQEHGLKITDEWFAQLLDECEDECDPLKHFREQFHVPNKAEALESLLMVSCNVSQHTGLLCAVEFILCTMPFSLKPTSLQGNNEGKCYVNTMAS